MAREGDQVVVTAVFAARTGKTSGQDSAIEVLSEIAFHIPGQAPARAIVAEGEEGLQVLLHKLVEHRLGRSAALVATDRTIRLLPRATGGIAPIRHRRHRFHSSEAIARCRRAGSALSLRRVDSIPDKCKLSPNAVSPRNCLGAQRQVMELMESFP